MEHTAQILACPEQDGRSAVHLLCQKDSVEGAEKLIMSVGHGVTRNSRAPDPIELLQDFVANLRIQLGSHGFVRSLSGSRRTVVE